MSSSFHVLLVFSMPFVAFAQQKAELAAAKAAAEQAAKTDVNQRAWGVVGFLCGSLTVAVAFTMQPPPLASRFVGKSPEHIRIYTQTYKAEIRNCQTGPAVLGCLGGTTLAFCLYILVFGE